jgi:hypothetical protein
MHDTIISRKRGEIFNKIKLAVNVGGTCDIKICDCNLQAKEKEENA